MLPAAALLLLLVDAWSAIFEVKKRFHFRGMGEGYRVNDAEFNARFTTLSPNWKTLLSGPRRGSTERSRQPVRRPSAGGDLFIYQFQKVIGITPPEYSGAINSPLLRRARLVECVAGAMRPKRQA